MITKFQQGGQAANQKALMQFVQGIAQVLKIDPKQIVQIVQQKPESLNAAVQVFQQTQDIQQAAQAFAQSVQKAKQGAKLQYLNSLKGICKKDEELVYMKSGGKVCSVCQKKKEIISNNPVKEFKAKCGGRFKAECGGRFKAKCGGKMKKKKKMEVGGQIPPKGPFKKTSKPLIKKQTPPKKQTPEKYDERKHKELIDRFKRNGYKPLPKASMDSLQWYNMHDPKEQGV